MGINWDIKNPPKLTWFQALRKRFRHRAVPLHCSNHYTKSHFEDDPLATPLTQPTLWG